MIVLTPEEHDEWVHLCGKRGMDLSPLDCRDCDLIVYCRSEHVIKGVDAFR